MSMKTRNEKPVLPYAVEAVERVFPARCPERAALFRVLLGPLPDACVKCERQQASLLCKLDLDQ